MAILGLLVLYVVLIVGVEVFISLYGSNDTDYVEDEESVF